MLRRSLLLGLAASLGGLACGRTTSEAPRATGSPRRWARLGGAALDAERLLDLAVDADDRLFAACASGILRSIDRGATWSRTLSTSGANVHRVRVDATGRVYAGELTGGRIAARLLCSDDHGERWTASAWDDGAAHASVVTGFAFLPSGVVLASGGFFPSTEGMFRRTTDRGVTWAPSAPARAAAAPRAATSLIAGPTGLLVAGTEGLGNLVSSDEGRTWARADIHDQQQTIALAYDSKGRFYAAAQGRGGVGNAVWVSTPDGRHWTELALRLRSRPHSLALDARDTIFAGTAAEGVFVSTDGGASWAPLNDGLPAAHVETPVSALLVDRAGYVYAALTTERGHMGGLFRTELPWA